MSIEIKVPAVGESITSGLISAWHKKDGEIVAAGDVLFTLETDKVSTEIAAEAAGKLSIGKAEGEEVKIGEVVGSIDDSIKAGAAAPAAAPAVTPAAPAAPVAPAETPKSTERADRLSPAVRVAIEEHKLKPSDIPGTGKEGQITKPDVIAYIEAKAEAKAAPTLPAATAPAPAPAPAAAGERETRKKLSPLRRKIASQLVQAQHTAAILTTFNEVDMTAVQELRAKAQDSFTKKHGIKLGFMSFFIKATVDALKSIPAINGRMEGDDFIQNNFYDIGVAVGTEKGLVVPVIRDADKKSFAETEAELVGYAKKARDGKIGINDLIGGGFTISNGGVYGSLLSTPILNPPQSGILGMHKIQQRPVVVGNEIKIRPMMYLALSYDHRVVDGKEAVTFLVRIKDTIEDPVRLLIDF
ncbi:MAG TPA: 2-oxoglutarate dehydrogenase complex dihydrolipoyllysine-residue succinyltransferase [Chthoniobacterales bacterium]